jgi:hypothetical protein
MAEHSTPRQRVEFGLDTIPPDRMVTVPLRDLMFVHQALAEFFQFFHQPMHYPDLAAVERFLGSRDSGDAFDVLHESVYKRMHEMLPPDIHRAFGEGERFEHPLPPSYHGSDDDDVV